MAKPKMTETFELPTVLVTWPEDKHPPWGQYPINAGPPAPSYGYETGAPLHVYQGPPNVPDTTIQHSAFSADAWHENLHGLPFVWPPATPPVPHPKLAPWDGPPTTFPFLRPAPDTREAKAAKPSIVHHILDMLGIASVGAAETEWTNTSGLHGPLSVPIAAVSHVDRDIAAEMFNPSPLATLQEGLFGQTSRTPGMLFDTGGIAE